jgi:GTP-dependent phosphoenolpyruvate carboxykinase
VFKELDAQDKQMREHLRDVLAGGMTGRVVGVFLFALGVVLSVIGNVVLA